MITKRAIPLNVSGGFHSPLMINAASKLGEVLEKYNAKKPKLPMLMNYNAEELDFNNLKNALKLLKFIHQFIFQIQSVK